jgi:hypothetical protein
LNPKYLKYGDHQGLSGEGVEECDEVHQLAVTEDVPEGEELQGDGECVDHVVRIIVDSAFQLISERESARKESDGSFSELSAHDSIATSTSRPKIYACPSCYKLFSQFPSSVKHCVKKKAVQLIDCPVCGKKIKDRKNLKSHLKFHNNDSNNEKKKVETKCEGCGKICASRQRLESHMRTKHGAKQKPMAAEALFRCTNCTFSHSKLSVVKTHFGKAHVQAARLACDNCDYTCLSHSGMYKHCVTVHKKSKNPEASSSSGRDAISLGALLPQAHSVDKDSESCESKLLAHDFPDLRPIARKSLPPVSCLSDGPVHSVPAESNHVQPLSPLPDLALLPSDIDDNCTFLTQNFNNLISFDHHRYNSIEQTKNGKIFMNL